MITRTHPRDYLRSIDLAPRQVRMCWNCGGICVDLPQLGVACIECHGTQFLPVMDCDLSKWRESLARYREIVVTPEPGSLEGVATLLALIDGVAAPEE